MPNSAPDIAPEKDQARNIEACLERLAARFGQRISRSESVRQHHASTLTSVAPKPADAVIWPNDEADVVAIVAAARAFSVPLVAFGAGTSLEGHVNAPHGGIAVDFSQMNRILAIRPDDLDCTVEAGVTRSQLNEALRHTGLFFSVDPGAEHATLAGMAATRASGTTTVGYGSMRDNVISLTAVIANGDVVKTGRRARKSAAGLDLTHLIVGSEGTLGLITSLTLRLYGVPETILAGTITFPSVDAACHCAIRAIQCGLRLARIELLDAAMMRLVSGQGETELAVFPTLFFELHGPSAACEADLAVLRTAVADCDGRNLRASAEADGRRRLWKARHDAFWAVKSAHPGRELLVTDVAVPLSHLAAAVAETAEDIARSGLDAPIVGHIGDGNFHAIVAFDPDDAGAVAKVGAFTDRLAQRALDFDGTVTGEHGIGEGKRRFMRAEHGPAVAVMQRIKQALDPDNILNPGKMLPE